MFYWEKLGLIYDPYQEKSRPDWRYNFAQGENVLIFDDFIRVYCCGREKPDEEGRTVSRVYYVDLYKDDPTRVMRVADHPVLELGKMGEFDEFGTYPFCPIRIDGKIYGYYGGVTRCESVPFTAAIGCCVSEDGGEHFHKIGPGPIIPNTPEEPFNLGSPKVRKFGDIYYMTYIGSVRWTKMAEGRPEVCYKLRMAKSTDGINWNKLNINILQDKLGDLESQACGDMIYRNGKYHMFYCYRNNEDFRRNPQNSYRIGYAVGDTPTVLNRMDDMAGIYRGEKETDFDHEMVAYPNLFEVNGHIYMLYLGNLVGEHGFALAELKGDL
jgi:hypothetical protein